MSRSSSTTTTTNETATMNNNHGRKTMIRRGSKYGLDDGEAEVESLPSHDPSFSEEQQQQQQQQARRRTSPNSQEDTPIASNTKANASRKKIEELMLPQLLSESTSSENQSSRLANNGSSSSSGDPHAASSSYYSSDDTTASSGDPSEAMQQSQAVQSEMADSETAIGGTSKRRPMRGDDESQAVQSEMADSETAIGGTSKRRPMRGDDESQAVQSEMADSETAIGGTSKRRPMKGDDESEIDSETATGGTTKRRRMKIQRDDSDTSDDDDDDDDRDDEGVAIEVQGADSNCTEGHVTIEVQLQQNAEDESVEVSVDSRPQNEDVLQRHSGDSGDTPGQESGVSKELLQMITELEGQASEESDDMNSEAQSYQSSEEYSQSEDEGEMSTVDELEDMAQSILSGDGSVIDRYVSIQESSSATEDIAISILTGPTSLDDDTIPSRTWSQGSSSRKTSSTKAVMLAAQSTDEEFAETTSTTQLESMAMGMLSRFAELDQSVPSRTWTQRGNRQMKRPLPISIPSPSDDAASSVSSQSKRQQQRFHDARSPRSDDRGMQRLHQLSSPAGRSPYFGSPMSPESEYSESPQNIRRAPSFFIMSPGESVVSPGSSNQASPRHVLHSTRYSNHEETEISPTSHDLNLALASTTPETSNSNVDASINQTVSNQGAITPSNVNKEAIAILRSLGFNHDYQPIREGNDEGPPRTIEKSQSNVSSLALETFGTASSYPATGGESTSNILEAHHHPSVRLSQLNHMEEGSEQEISYTDPQTSQIDDAPSNSVQDIVSLQEAALLSETSEEFHTSRGTLEALQCTESFQVDGVRDADISYHLHLIESQSMEEEPSVNFEGAQDSIVQNEAKIGVSFSLINTNVSETTAEGNSSLENLKSVQGIEQVLDIVQDPTQREMSHNASNYLSESSEEMDSLSRNLPQTFESALAHSSSILHNTYPSESTEESNLSSGSPEDVSESTQSIKDDLRRAVTSLTEVKGTEQTIHEEQAPAQEVFSDNYLSGSSSEETDSSSGNFQVSSESVHSSSRVHLVENNYPSTSTEETSPSPGSLEEASLNTQSIQDDLRRAVSSLINAYPSDSAESETVEASRSIESTQDGSRECLPPIVASSSSSASEDSDQSAFTEVSVDTISHSSIQQRVSESAKSIQICSTNSEQPAVSLSSQPVEEGVTELAVLGASESTESGQDDLPYPLPLALMSSTLSASADSSQSAYTEVSADSTSQSSDEEYPRIDESAAGSEVSSTTSSEENAPVDEDAESALSIAKVEEAPTLSSVLVSYLSQSSDEGDYPQNSAGSPSTVSFADLIPMLTDVNSNDMSTEEQELPMGDAPSSVRLDLTVDVQSSISGSTQSSPLSSVVTSQSFVSTASAPHLPTSPIKNQHFQSAMQSLRWFAVPDAVQRLASNVLNRNELPETKNVLVDSGDSENISRSSDAASRGVSLPTTPHHETSSSSPTYSANEQCPQHIQPGDEADNKSATNNPQQLPPHAAGEVELRRSIDSQQDLNLVSSESCDDNEDAVWNRLKAVSSTETAPVVSSTVPLESVPTVPPIVSTQICLPSAPSQTIKVLNPTIMEPRPDVDQSDAESSKRPERHESLQSLASVASEVNTSSKIASANDVIVMQEEPIDRADVIASSTANARPIDGSDGEVARKPRTPVKEVVSCLSLMRVPTVKVANSTVLEARPSDESDVEVVRGSPTPVKEAVSRLPQPLAPSQQKTAINVDVSLGTRHVASASSSTLQPQNISSRGNTPMSTKKNRLSSLIARFEGSTPEKEISSHAHASSVGLIRDNRFSLGIPLAGMVTTYTVTATDTAETTASASLYVESESPIDGSEVAVVHDSPAPRKKSVSPMPTVSVATVEVVGSAVLEARPSDGSDKGVPRGSPTPVKEAVSPLPPVSVPTVEAASSTVLEARPIDGSDIAVARDSPAPGKKVVSPMPSMSVRTIREVVSSAVLEARPSDGSDREVVRGSPTPAEEAVSPLPPVSVPTVEAASSTVLEARPIDGSDIAVACDSPAPGKKVVSPMPSMSVRTIREVVSSAVLEARPSDGSDKGVPRGSPTPVEEAVSPLPPVSVPTVEAASSTVLEARPIDGSDIAVARDSPAPGKKVVSPMPSMSVRTIREVVSSAVLEARPSDGSDREVVRGSPTPAEEAVSPLPPVSVPTVEAASSTVLEARPIDGSDIAVACDSPAPGKKVVSPMPSISVRSIREVVSSAVLEARPSDGSDKGVPRGSPTPVEEAVSPLPPVSVPTVEAASSTVLEARPIDGSDIAVARDSPAPGKKVVSPMPSMSVRTIREAVKSTVLDTRPIEGSDGEFARELPMGGRPPRREALSPPASSTPEVTYSSIMVTNDTSLVHEEVGCNDAIAAGTTAVGTTVASVPSRSIPAQPLAVDAQTRVSLAYIPTVETRPNIDPSDDTFLGVSSMIMRPPIREALPSLPAVIPEVANSSVVAGSYVNFVDVESGGGVKITGAVEDARMMDSQAVWESVFAAAPSVSAANTCIQQQAATNVSSIEEVVETVSPQHAPQSPLATTYQEPPRNGITTVPIIPCNPFDTYILQDSICRPGTPTDQLLPQASADDFCPGERTPRIDNCSNRIHAPESRAHHFFSTEISGPEVIRPFPTDGVSQCQTRLADQHGSTIEHYAQSVEVENHHSRQPNISQKSFGSSPISHQDPKLASTFLAPAQTAQHLMRNQSLNGANESITQPTNQVDCNNQISSPCAPRNLANAKLLPISDDRKETKNKLDPLTGATSNESCDREKVLEVAPSPGPAQRHVLSLASNFGSLRTRAPSPSRSTAHEWPQQKPALESPDGRSILSPGPVQSVQANASSSTMKVDTPSRVANLAANFGSIRAWTPSRDKSRLSAIDGHQTRAVDVPHDRDIRPFPSPSNATNRSNPDPRSSHPQGPETNGESYVNLSIRTSSPTNLVQGNTLSSTMKVDTPSRVANLAANFGSVRAWTPSRDKSRSSSIDGHQTRAVDVPHDRDIRPFPSPSNATNRSNPDPRSFHPQGPGTNGESYVNLSIRTSSPTNVVQGNTSSSTMKVDTPSRVANLAANFGSVRAWTPSRDKSRSSSIDGHQTRAVDVPHDRDIRPFPSPSNATNRSNPDPRLSHLQGPETNGESYVNLSIRTSSPTNPVQGNASSSTMKVDTPSRVANLAANFGSVRAWTPSRDKSRSSAIDGHQTRAVDVPHDRDIRPFPSPSNAINRSNPDPRSSHPQGPETNGESYVNLSIRASSPTNPVQGNASSSTMKVDTPSRVANLAANFGSVRAWTPSRDKSRSSSIDGHQTRAVDVPHDRDIRPFPSPSNRSNPDPRSSHPQGIETSWNLDRYPRPAPPLASSQKKTVINADESRGTRYVASASSPTLQPSKNSSLGNTPMSTKKNRLSSLIARFEGSTPNEEISSHAHASSGGLTRDDRLSLGTPLTEIVSACTVIATDTPKTTASASLYVDGEQVTNNLHELSSSNETVASLSFQPSHVNGKSIQPTTFVSVREETYLDQNNHGHSIEPMIMQGGDHDKPSSQLERHETLKSETQFHTSRGLLDTPSSSWNISEADHHCLSPNINIGHTSGPQPSPGESQLSEEVKRINNDSSDHQVFNTQSVVPLTPDNPKVGVGVDGPSPTCVTQHPIASKEHQAVRRRLGLSQTCIISESGSEGVNPRDNVQVVHTGTTTQNDVEHFLILRESERKDTVITPRLKKLRIEIDRRRRERELKVKLKTLEEERQHFGKAREASPVAITTLSEKEMSQSIPEKKKCKELSVPNEGNYVVGTPYGSLKVAALKGAFDDYDRLLDQVIRQNKVLKRGGSLSETSLGGDSELVLERVAIVRTQRDIAVDEYDVLLDGVLTPTKRKRGLASPTTKTPLPIVSETEDNSSNREITDSQRKATPVHQGAQASQLAKGSGLDEVGQKEVRALSFQVNTPSRTTTRAVIIDGVLPVGDKKDAENARKRRSVMPTSPDSQMNASIIRGISQAKRSIIDSPRQSLTPNSPRRSCLPFLDEIEDERQRSPIPISFDNENYQASAVHIMDSERINSPKRNVGSLVDTPVGYKDARVALTERLRSRSESPRKDYTSSQFTRKPERIDSANSLKSVKSLIDAPVEYRNTRVTLTDRIRSRSESPRKDYTSSQFTRKPERIDSANSLKSVKSLIDAPVEYRNTRVTLTDRKRSRSESPRKDYTLSQLARKSEQNRSRLLPKSKHEKPPLQNRRATPVFSAGDEVQAAKQMLDMRDSTITPDESYELVAIPPEMVGAIRELIAVSRGNTPTEREHRSASPSEPHVKGVKEPRKTREDRASSRNSTPIDVNRTRRSPARSKPSPGSSRSARPEGHHDKKAKNNRGLESSFSSRGGTTNNADDAYYEAELHLLSKTKATLDSNRDDSVWQSIQTIAKLGRRSPMSSKNDSREATPMTRSEDCEKFPRDELILAATPAREAFANYPPTPSADMNVSSSKLVEQCKKIDVQEFDSLEERFKVLSPKLQSQNSTKSSPKIGSERKKSSSRVVEECGRFDSREFDRLEQRFRALSQKVAATTPLPALKKQLTSCS